MLLEREVIRELELATALSPCCASFNELSASLDDCCATPATSLLAVLISCTALTIDSDACPKAWFTLLFWVATLLSSTPKPFNSLDCSNISRINCCKLSKKVLNSVAKSENSSLDVTCIRPVKSPKSLR